MKQFLGSYASCFFILLISLFAQEGFGQVGGPKRSSINFRNVKDWKEIVKVARSENKGIFVDCYATWCGPCKYMDNNTYLESGVAAFYNRQFVSIRVQCDTGKSDDPHVKSWYADARELIRRYRVYKYPCFLFFSPKGEPLNIGFGAKAPDDFVSLGKDALNPQRQYFSLLRRVSAGYMDTSACPYLIQTAEEMGEHEVARTIAKKYIDSFWIQLPEREKWTKNNLFFLTYCFGQKFIGSNDSAFKAFYNNQAKVGEVTGDVQLARRYVE